MKTVFGLLVMMVSLSSYSQKHFVKSENSKHSVTINEEGSALRFDGRTYFVDRKRGWYKGDKDSIVWLYGHDLKNWKDMVKVGFYNNYKNYVVSIKTEKKP